MPFNMKKSILSYTIIAAAGLCLTAATSCKTKHPATVTEPASKKIASAQELLEAVDGHRPVYANLNIKYSAKIKTPKGDNSIRGKLKIRRDSCVWVSALPLGIEAARIIATKEETGLVNYLQKEYFRGGYEILGSLLGYRLDYGMLQSALTGEPVFYTDRNRYRFDDEKRNGYYFSPYEKNRFEKITDGRELPDDGAHTVQALWFAPETVLLSKNVLYDVDQKRYLEINYSDYLQVGRDLFPTRIRIDIKTPKQTDTFTVEYSRIDADAAEMEYPFTVPASYTQMQIR